MTFINKFDTIKIESGDLMNLSSLIIILIFGILIFLGIIVIIFYTRLCFRRDKVLDKFDSVYDTLHERIEIIESIINIIQEENYPEERIKINLNNLSKELKQENNNNNLILLIDKSNKIIEEALSLETAYPLLRNNKKYLEIKKDFNNNKFKIMYSIEIYNEEVEVYNSYKSKLGINLISQVLKFPDYSYYKKKNDI